MFSKAKRFDPLAPVNNLPNPSKKHEKENENQKPKMKAAAAVVAVKPKSKPAPATAAVTRKPTTAADTQSQCSSVKSVKSFATPKPMKPVTKAPSSLKKLLPPKNEKAKNFALDDIMKSQEVEIRNKDYTITEYNKQIEELKNEIANLQKQVKGTTITNEFENLDKQLSEITLDDKNLKSKDGEIKESGNNTVNYDGFISNLSQKISELEQQCDRLEQEASSKQVELSSLEEIITIRDSLCKDLQNKLTNMETSLDETRQRLEMVKGHHALALEANESIRREYKVELESLKLKFDEEKQTIINKSKADQESIKTKYNTLIEEIKDELTKDRDDLVNQLQMQLTTKDNEMKAKLEQIDEATREKLRLCEIQFEERSRSIQEHWSQQQKQVQFLENEVKDLKFNLVSSEEENVTLQREVNILKDQIEILKTEKSDLIKETDELQEESKKKLIDFENQINKLTVEVDKATKEKQKFEMSLSVTRDIVQVLTMRLRESDNELEHLEGTVQTLMNSKELLENELTTYKSTLNNTVLECNEYKEALVDILKSKAALAKEHTRIMEHNVSLIESLQNVEKEAYRELGSIKNELIEDVEYLKKESNSQIKMLRDEVQKKRMLCELATEHAGHATAAAEQSRVLVAQAAAEISRLEADNKRLQQQIQDQQSLVVELSLLRQENEELTMTLAKQSSIVDKMKKDAEHIQTLPKSPSMMRKTHKSGKENLQVVISPLRERNH